MTSSTAYLFNDAASLYAAAPSPKTLLNLNRYAMPLLTATREPAWKSVDSPETFTMPFTRIRIVCSRRLDAEEALRVAGFAAYALRATLAGEELGQHVVSFAVADNGSGAAFTIIEADYDSDTSIRTEPDPNQAFALARLFAAEGTPARRTNRVGPCGTRLIERVGGCNVAFFVQ